jgi:hypothetical protein
MIAAVTRETEGPMVDIAQPNDIDEYRARWFPDGPKAFQSRRSRIREYFGIEETPEPAPDPRKGPDAPLQRQRKRAYGTSFLPVLTDTGAAKSNADDLRLALYEQALAAWKQLVDVRFKLLALLPAVSVIALATVIAAFRDSSRSYRVALLLVDVAAVAITAAMWIYDKRNSELHDDLISRARRIEAELGVHTGVMLGRLGSRGIVRHGIATGIVYSVIGAAWLVTGVWMAIAIA